MASTDWRRFFTEWPDDLPKRGVIIAAFGEQVPFSGFLTGERFLLLERQTPDTSGARTLLFSYEQVTALKIIDVVKPSVFRQLGFNGSLSAP